jgi:hypothetical protein
VGPDFVTVGVPCSFDCAAQCSPSCSYRMSIDGQIGQGNELFFTARQWEESLNLTCTARNNDSGRSSTVSKILQVLGGCGVCWFVFMRHNLKLVVHGLYDIWNGVIIQCLLWTLCLDYWISVTKCLYRNPTLNPKQQAMQM